MRHLFSVFSHIFNLSEDLSFELSLLSDLLQGSVSSTASNLWSIFVHGSLKCSPTKFLSLLHQNCFLGFVEFSCRAQGSGPVSMNYVMLHVRLTIDWNSFT